MVKTAQQYFEELVTAVGKHTTELFPSVVLAQAILESGLFTTSGPSGLAVKYNNFFGIKASKSWTGKVTPGLDTEEDDGSGKKQTIKAGFRWYDSLIDSVKDHNNMFQTDFSKSFYKHVLNATTPTIQTQALQGTYATDTAYASKLNAIITRYNLTQYDSKNTTEVKGEMVTAQQVINEAKKYVGANKYSNAHKAIINHYNTQNPLPRGTKMTYDWDWCAAYVSFILMKVGLSKLYGTEISVGYYKQKFIDAKIWRGRVRPQVGDIVIWQWDGSHTGWPHHIGLVASVNGDYFTTIEGNTFKNGVSTVGSNTFKYNASTVQGFARPDYTKATTPSTKLTFEQAVQAVINGTMGNGATRIENIKASGQDPQKVQTEVNKRLSNQSTPTPTKTKEQAVKDVIAGKYGSGKERHDKLTKEGFNADEIQSLVNKALKPTIDFSGHKNTIKLSKDLEILTKVGGSRRGLATKGTEIKFDEVYINNGLYIAYLNGTNERCYIKIADMVGNKLQEIQGTVSKA